jgi:D-glycero-alpha-D-manno-heptose-7-phosphate kinase
MGTQEPKEIRAQAPTRIDLAGGTVDLWPLYLFLNQPVTLNLSIDLTVEAILEITTPNPSQITSNRTELICLRSLDQNVECRFTWASLEEGIKPPTSLELHYRLLKFFSQKLPQTASKTQAITLTTRAKSPAGAGLGGSSALSIALIGALATWVNQGVDPLKNGEDFIEIVRDIETTVIQVPAGLQDYYAAMYGGLQSLHWGPGTHRRTQFDESLIPELESRLLLFYSGQSRNSGINNWALFKDFIDQKAEVRDRFKKIVDASLHLHRALVAHDWKEVGKAIAEEWDVRKTLAAGITTPEIDRALSEAQKLGPLSGKICGAGGGGCFFVYLPDASETRREQLLEIFASHGMKFLDFRGARKGLEVQTLC